MYSPRGIKVGVVKHQEKLVLVLETLDRVGGTLGEVPDVAVVEGLELGGALLVNDGDEDGSGVDKAPFGLNDTHNLLDTEQERFLAIKGGVERNATPSSQE